MRQLLLSEKQMDTSLGEHAGVLKPSKSLAVSQHVHRYVRHPSSGGCLPDLMPCDSS